MSNQFSMQEIVEIAIEIEKNGAEFYSALAKSANTARLRELFVYLSEEEKKHIDRFHEILQSVGGYQISEVYYAAEYMGYMKALADEYVFKKAMKPAQVASHIKSSREAIDIAIGFEKDTIIFLHEMWGMMNQSDRESIQKLLNEEREHIRRLSAIKALMQT